MKCNDTIPQKPGDDADVFEVCPVARAFEIVGSKWRLIVLRCLQLWGEQRFTELQEASTADSATLSRVLDELGEQDLVERRLEDQPIRTYYSLTDRGEDLADVFEAYEEWSLEWTDAEAPAQQATD